MDIEDYFRIVDELATECLDRDVAPQDLIDAAGQRLYAERRNARTRAGDRRAREPARTTKLYDRTSDEITLDEIERIGI
jgi:hypothetical protein